MSLTLNYEFWVIRLPFIIKMDLFQSAEGLNWTRRLFSPGKRIFSDCLYLHYWLFWFSKLLAFTLGLQCWLLDLEPISSYYRFRLTSSHNHVSQFLISQSFSNYIYISIYSFLQILFLWRTMTNSEAHSTPLSWVFRKSVVKLMYPDRSLNDLSLEKLTQLKENDIGRSCSRKGQTPTNHLTVPLVDKLHLTSLF